ncbi:MAG: hypothetical protein KatS3mg124_1858 [Porticoccaceae bacterium]|nr:MAG: hypothetical protein KatS3mg124_1858 [Porticoccaceae bacterium]
MAGECAACPLLGKGLVVSRRGERWTAYHGDALHVLRDLAQEQPESVDAIITDPPYGTGANSIAGRLASTSKKYSNVKTKKWTPSPAIPCCLTPGRR